MTHYVEHPRGPQATFCGGSPRPPPLPIQSRQPKVILCTAGPTAYCVKHFGTQLSPKEAVQDSRETKMAIAGRYARIARQHLPPNCSTSPRWVAVTRWSPAADPLLIDLDTSSPPPDCNFADLLLIDTGCRLLPDFVHQTPDICQLICPQGQVNLCSNICSANEYNCDLKYPWLFLLNR